MNVYELLEPKYALINLQEQKRDAIQVIVYCVDVAYFEDYHSFRKKEMESINMIQALINNDEEVVNIAERHAVCKNVCEYRGTHLQYIEQGIKKQQIDLLRYIIKAGLDGFQKLHGNRKYQETEKGQDNRRSYTGREGEQYFPVSNNSKAIRDFRSTREDKDSSNRNEG